MVSMLTVTADDQVSSLSSNLDCIKVSIEKEYEGNMSVVLADHLNNGRRIVALVDGAKDYADVTITVSTIQLNNDLYKSLRISNYPR